MRQGEERVIVALLLVFVVAMASLGFMLGSAATSGTETGVCERQARSSLGYYFPPMH